MRLNEIQLDALTEVANIGAGKAAKHLSILLNDTVRMTVPKVALGSFNEIEPLLNVQMDETMVGIEQKAMGLLDAKVTFLFYSKNSASLAQELVSGSNVLKKTDSDLLALQYDAITEIGNIVVASCIKSLSDLLKGSIQLSLPIYKEGPLSELFKHLLTEEKKSPDIMVMKTHIEAELRNVSGVLILVISQSDIKLLITAIDRWIDELKNR